MKVKNKKTGEIADIEINSHHLAIVYEDGRVEQFFFDSLKDLADWEDYEEPEVIYYISWDGMVLNSADRTGWQNAKLIGNYFETKEEAEKAVEKLKAWKRLRDKGFRFAGYTHKDRGRLDELEIYCQLGECPENIEEMDDVHLLFGGEK